MSIPREWVPKLVEEEVARRFSGSGGPPGGGGQMESRVAGLEATCRHIEGHITDIKIDIRGLRDKKWTMFVLGVGAAAVLAGMVILSYLMLSAKIDQNNAQMADIRVKLAEIAESVKKK